MTNAPPSDFAAASSSVTSQGRDVCAQAGVAWAAANPTSRQVTIVAADGISAPRFGYSRRKRLFHRAAGYQEAFLWLLGAVTRRGLTLSPPLTHAIFDPFETTKLPIGRTKPMAKLTLTIDGKART